MKNIISSPIFIVILFFSCNLGNDIANDDSSSGCESKNIIDYDFVGEIHNDYLVYANEAFPSHQIFNLPLEEIMPTKLQILSNYSPPNYLNIQLFENDSFNLDLINYLTGDIYGNYRDDFEALLDDLINANKADAVDKQIILALIDYIKEAANSYEEVMLKISTLESIWEQQNYTTCTSKGDISAYILSIAKHSFSFWNNNLRALKNIHNINSNSRLWWVVAAVAYRDVLGGLAGMAVSQITEYAITGNIGGEDGIVSGDEALTQFLSGAITGSIGF